MFLYDVVNKQWNWGKKNYSKLILKKILKRKTWLYRIRTKIFFHLVFIKPTRYHWANTEFLNIERLKSDLKISPVRLDLAYFQPKDNFLFISGSSLHFLKWCSKSLIEKRIHNTFQIHRLWIGIFNPMFSMAPATMCSVLQER